jgi:hypothetical protein
VPQTPTAPGIQAVVPGNSRAFLIWHRTTNGSFESADHYRIYVSTTPNPGPLNHVLVTTTRAQPTSFATVSPLSNGTPYYFAVSAINNSLEGPTSSAVGPITIGTPSGPFQVSGQVNLSGVTPTGQLSVVVYSSESVHLNALTPTAGANAFSIAGVPNGAYYVFASLDQDSSGTLDLGEPSTFGAGTFQTVSVAGADATTATLTLLGDPAFPHVTTHHQQSGASDQYFLIFQVGANTKLPVLATVQSGPHIFPPIDLGLDATENQGPGTNTMGYVQLSSPPNVGDSYAIGVTYADGTTGNLNGSVTGVVGLPILTSPLTTGPTVPTFNWGPPASPPSLYSYQITVWSGFGGDIWHVEPLASTVSSILYNSDGLATVSPLTAGSSYSWKISVRDSNGNDSEQSTSFQAQ